MGRKKALKNVKRIVIKVGTSTLTHETGLINYEMMEKLIRQISNLKNRGYEIALVSSGAVGAGLGILRNMKRPMSIPEKQAAASVGQVTLIHLYQKMFLEYNQNISQILLTKSDMSNRERYLNAKDVFFELFKNDIIPIVNENDAVITDEIKVGDNDTLSALVANLIGADLLIILSDIDGLYDSNPMEDKNAKLINEVEDLEKVISFAKDSSTASGTGGMITKLNAAEIVNSYGIDMIIAKGNEENILNRLLSCENLGTLFIKDKNIVNAKQQWIGFGSIVEGTIIIDDGAKKAISNNNSLLSVGVKEIKGDFSRGSTVEIIDDNGNIIGRGLVNYDSDSLLKIKGLKSNKIIEVLGYKNCDDVVHINNMMLRGNIRE